MPLVTLTTVSMQRTAGWLVVRGRCDRRRFCVHETSREDCRRNSQWTESPGADIEMPKASKESDMGKGCPIPTEGEVSGGGIVEMPFL